ncbi:MAG TPA: lipid-A-disaccharide synthase [Caulobacteraceae bacterium]|jgi:lipid-A-disaccharide synthase
MRPSRVLITAVEASGDALGAALMRELTRRLPEETTFIGVGGPQMQAEGLASLFDISELSVMGFLEGLLAYRRAQRRAAEIAGLARREQPDVAVLIDSWGFSYLTAKALRRALPDLPLVKYVAPQVWATRPGRAQTVAALFDHLLSIIPFDQPYFADLPIQTTFVGNPALSRDFSGADGEGLRARLGIAPDSPVLLVLPGSRPGEIKRVMPALEDAARRLKGERPALEVIIPVAPTVAEAVKVRAAQLPFQAHVVLGGADKHAAMAAATAALACSGTVTTELAMAGCPMVVAYKLSPLTAVIARRIVRVPYASLINIAAGEAVAPEFIQEDCTGPRLAAAVGPLLDNPALRAAQTAAQNRALDRLGRGGPDPAERSAQVIEAILRSRSPRPSPQPRSSRGL